MLRCEIKHNGCQNVFRLEQVIAIPKMREPHAFLREIHAPSGVDGFVDTNVHASKPQLV
jgi:hypothetical protein